MTILARLTRTLIVGMLLSLVTATAMAQGTRWPGGARAAIVLTYDDALPSQLDIVVPALRKAGLRGTFFLSAVREGDVDRWRAAARDGNELANHTIFHPCAAATFATDPRYTLERYTPDGLLREIAQQNVLLRAIDGKTRRGYATTCGQTLAGGQDYLEPLRRSGLVTYARGVTTEPADLSADVATIDRMHVPSQGFAEGTTLAQLIALAERARDGHGWAVYLFHGVGGDHLRVSAEVHRAFLQWLAAHRRDYWVTTLQEALDVSQRGVADRPAAPGRTRRAR